MEEPSHPNPPARSTKHNENDEEFGAIKPFNPNHQNRSSKCLVYTLLIIVVQSIALLIFGRVVLRIRTPTLRLSNIIAIKDLRYQSAFLNMTMVAEIRLRNMNFGGFDFHGANTTLSYENASIGVGGIYSGRVGSREKKRLNVTVKVMMTNNGVLSESYHTDFSRDVSLGFVKLKGFMKLRGKVSVLKIISSHRNALMNCTLALNLTSQAIQDLMCQ